MKNKDMNNIIFTYVIVFKNEKKSNIAMNWFKNTKELKITNEGKYHQFDNELIPTLPAVEYCLHMPVSPFDIVESTVDYVEEFDDVGHKILVVSEEILFAFGRRINPTLVIICDDCTDETILFAQNMKAELGVVYVRELGRDLLINHWSVLGKNRNITEFELSKKCAMHFFLNEKKLSSLPLVLIERFYGNVSDVYNAVFNSVDILRTNSILLMGRKIKNLFKDYVPEDQDVGEENLRRFVELNGQQLLVKSALVNLVITLPGIPNVQIKYAGLSESIPDVESRVIRDLGVHRAIAKNAVLLEINSISKELYRELNSLELNCSNGTNNAYIHKKLRDIGRMIEEIFTDEQIEMLRYSKHVTVFSDFPIGLGILSGTDTPLCCYKDFSYRTLSPLTRCFQLELMGTEVVELNKKCKIIFAECIPNDEANKLIRDFSSNIISVLQDLSKQYGHIEFVYKETLTVNELKSFILDNRDADILHISAHGNYLREQNIAGIMVGDEFWMADDNDVRFPPVVVLSACHVNPRGTGVVSISDLLLRNGATAVLGTFVKINAERNSMLMMRFYSYLAKVAGEKENKWNMINLWTGVVATNVIFEMVKNSDRLFEWFVGENSKKIIRYKDYLSRRDWSVISKNTYQDSISVIKEMLHEEGLDGKYDDILNHKNYFPESLFYQWIGWPEMIHLN